jgi:uncharacterized protein YrzB (UPF0473 family)
MGHDKRKFIRFSLQLKARCLHKTGWHACSILNVSREGMELTLSDTAGLGKGDTIETEVLFPGREEPIKLAGQIAYVQKRSEKTDTQNVGVKLTHIDAAEKWDLLETAYNDWYSKELKRVEQKPQQKKH